MALKQGARLLALGWRAQRLGAESWGVGQATPHLTQEHGS